MKKLFLSVAAALALAIGFSATTVQAQNLQTPNEMQQQINELRELVSTLLALLGNQQSQSGIPNISSQRARDIAVDFIGHGTVNDVFLFTENNNLLYEVDIRHEGVRYMVYIFASSGDVLRMSRYEDGFQGITTLPAPLPIASPSASPRPAASPSPTASPAPNNNQVHNRNNRPTNPAISLERAIEIAQADLARRNITATFRRDSGMSWERNQWVWELEFRPTTGRGEIEYYINVTTGAIVKFEWDR